MTESKIPGGYYIGQDGKPRNGLGELIPIVPALQPQAPGPSEEVIPVAEVVPVAGAEAPKVITPEPKPVKVTSKRVRRSK